MLAKRAGYTNSKSWEPVGESELLIAWESSPHGTGGISLFIVPKIWVNPDGALGDSNDVCFGNSKWKHPGRIFLTFG
jgi:hypothetical protein